MAPRPDHTILYDADCGFCTRVLDRIVRWDRRGRLRAVPIQGEEGDRLLAAVPAERRLSSWHLVDPDGEVHSAGSAAPPLLRLLPGGRAPAALLARLPRLTDAAYRWIAAHRGRLGRLLVLGLALVVAGCGSTAGGDARLTVYLSAPLQGPAAASGHDVVRGARRALEDADGEAGGVAVRLAVRDDAVEAGRHRPAGPTQARIAANARAATEDSTTIAYLGELASAATVISAPITNEAGILQLSPGPVAQGLLAEPGGTDVPGRSQPSGQRTLGALLPEGARLRRAGAEDAGYEAMALVLDSVDRAGDPLSRSSVLGAFYDTADRRSRLGTYTIDPVGRAAFASGGGPASGG